MYHLSSRGYRTIAFDRRGFGRSDQPWTGYDYDTFADDIHQLIEHLQLTDITLVGFSMSGGDVTRYIARHGTSKVAKLALLGSVVPAFVKSDDHPQGIDECVFTGIKAGILKDRAQFLTDFNPIFFGIDIGQKVSSAILNRTMTVAMLASLKATIGCVTAFSMTDFRPDMDKINVPTLAIHGSSDVVAPYEATAKLATQMIADCTVKLYEGAPHGFPVTHTDRLNEDLLEFLQS